MRSGRKRGPNDVRILDAQPAAGARDHVHEARIVAQAIEVGVGLDDRN